jgi:uncharacterized protein (TIGR00369 family)
VFDARTAQQIIDNSPFSSYWGFRVASVGEGEATLVLPARDEFLRPGGVLQGGCAMTLADVAVWIAVLSWFGADDRAVTQSMTTSFLRPGRDDLTCVARVLRPGRQVVYSTATTHDSDEQLIAHHTVTYMRPAAS